VAVRTKTPLRFRGAPESLSAMLLDVEAPPDSIAVRLKLPRADGSEFEAAVSPEEGRARVFLALPRQTPPGRYEGVARLGEDERPVVAVVEPDPVLDIEPGSVILSARAGEHVEVDFTVFNAGNVAVELRGAHVFGLFPDQGAERAILEAHTAKADEARRIDRLMDALAGEFAGTVRLRLKSGAGPLEPGAGRELVAELTMPKGLRPGRCYAGGWSFAGLNCSIRVDVPEEVR
jgi:hypothetical protein